MFFLFLAYAPHLNSASVIFSFESMILLNIDGGSPWLSAISVSRTFGWAPDHIQFVTISSFLLFTATDSSLKINE
jgi:hypothetical protein